uniref:ORF37 n=1 Tax=Malaco herpesvirus 1 TaxID=3031797 RepID=A0AA48P7R7_9VIRU|nr:TPA_asm: ORF37 [Malaco herpesvirus 1]
MKVLDFAQFAPGVETRGVGHLYYALHERYRTSSIIETRLHFMKKLDDGKRGYPIISGFKRTTTLYKYGPLLNRFILPVEVKLTDLQLKISAVEIVIHNEVGNSFETLFMIKRNGIYKNPYKQDVKVVTTAELPIPEDGSRETDPCEQFSANKNCNDLIKAIQEATRLKNAKINEPPKVSEMDVDVSSPYILQPKDKSTPSVPFWFSHDQWRYYENAFEIEDGRVPKSHIQQFNFGRVAHGLFLNSYNNDMNLIPPTGNLVNITLENDSILTHEDMKPFIDYINLVKFNVLLSLMPKECDVDYFSVDKGKMYGCVKLDDGVRNVTDYPFLLHNTFVQRYRYFKNFFRGKKELGSNYSIKLYIHAGVYIGIEADGEMIYGTREAIPNRYLDFMQSVKRINQNLSMLETVPQELYDWTDDTVAKMALDAAKDIPFTIEFTEELNMVINHPLIYGTLVEEISELSQVDEHVMFQHNTFTEIGWEPDI